VVVTVKLCFISVLLLLLLQLLLLLLLLSVYDAEVQNFCTLVTKCAMLQTGDEKVDHWFES